MSHNNKKIVPFNKKNAIKFGQTIYAENGNRISCIKLSCIELQDHYKINCIIGEAFCHFVQEDLFMLTRNRSQIYDIKYSSNYADCSGMAQCIDMLVYKALLKTNNKHNQNKLACELCIAVDINDSTDSYLERAQDVAKYWNRKIVPLLK